MAVPGFTSWLTPLLSKLQDGNERRMANIYDELADELALSEADRSEMLPSGATPTYKNRISWACTFLKKANLLEQTGRALVRITERGRTVLREHPEPINVAFLGKFPEFAEWQGMSRRNDNADVKVAETTESPEDTLSRVYQRIRGELSNELLDRIKASPPSFFEKLVVDLMIKMGYGGAREDAGRTVGKSGDGGIDGVINEDRLGLDVIYLQAKRWEGVIGRPAVQAFVGSLAGMRANKGVFITTSKFTADARAYVQQIGAKVVLIDGEMLGSLMIQHGLAVTTSASYEVKRIDSDYFDE